MQTTYKPEQIGGRFKVFVVEADDDNRERVMEFQVDEFTMDSEPNYENVYTHEGPCFPVKKFLVSTTHRAEFGELKDLDENGTKYRVIDFSKEFEDEEGLD